MRPHRSLCVQYIYIHHPAKNFSVPRWFHQLLKGTSLHLNLCWSLASPLVQQGRGSKYYVFMWWHPFSTNSTAPLLEEGQQTIQQYENELTNPVFQLVYHRHNPFKVQNCLDFYSSSSTSGGNVGLFEHTVVLWSCFILSAMLQVPGIR